MDETPPPAYPRLGRLRRSLARRPWLPAAGFIVGGALILGASQLIPPDPRSVTLDMVSTRTAGVMSYVLMCPEVEGDPPVVSLASVSTEGHLDATRSRVSVGGQGAVASRKPAAFALRGPPFLLGLLVLAMLAGVGATGLTMHLFRWLRARSVRSQLGKATLPDHQLDGQRAVVSGRLVAEGALTHRFEDGERAAATSALVSARRQRGFDGSTSLNRRAERLWLVDGQTRVLVRDPVEVRLGSHELARMPSAECLAPDIVDRLTTANEGALDWLAGGPVALKSLTPGDRVRVAGRLRLVPQADEPISYRQLDCRWELEGAEEPGAPVKAVFDGVPRVHRARSRFVPLAVGAGMGVAVFVTSMCTTGALTFVW